jgi:hypothetical protein
MWSQQLHNAATSNLLMPLAPLLLQAMQSQLAGAVEELSLLAQRHRHMAQSLDPLAKTLRTHLAHLEQLEA